MSPAPRIAVVDYGIGNLRSAQKALEKCGATATLTSDPATISAADAVVLPGVGAFGACMESLRAASGRTAHGILESGGTQ
ncbi:MAG: imidazole glycerol phosphate synthase subunit HisH, partial [Actinomycetota bacterium]